MKVFVLLSDIPDGNFFQLDEIVYKKCVTDMDVDNNGETVPALTNDYTIKCFKPDTIVRRCSESGSPLRTKAEAKADKEKSNRWDKAYDKLQLRVEKALKKKKQNMEVIYSAYDDDENGIPVDNLDDVPVKGKVKFILEPDDWNDGYESEVVESPTWLDIAVLANDMIKIGGDKHHVFLEGVYTIKKVKGIQICEFSMGS